MTPLGLLIAIVVACVVCSALLIFVMVAASPTPACYRRLNVGTVGAGLLIVLFGLFEFSIARKAEKGGKLSYHRGAPVTSAQRYAAAAGFVTLGLAAAVVALLHRKRRSGDVSTPPSISPNESL